MDDRREAVPPDPSSRGLRIVLVMIEPPLPFGSACGRWHHVLLKGLTERGHDVTAFAACSRPGDIAAAEALFPRSRYDLRCYAFPERSGPARKLATLRRPFSYQFSAALRADVEAELERGYDILHLEQMWSGWLGLAHRSRAVLNVHYLDHLDVAPSEALSLEERVFTVLRRRAERRLIRSYPRLTTLTPELTKAVHAISPRAHVRTVPMTLDVSLYPYRPSSSAHEGIVVSLIGSFGWGPSYSAGVRLITRLWPRIKEQLPSARLQIVGQGAEAAFGSLASPGVSLHSDVPDTLPYFHGADVLLYAPEAGSGMKVKILEAFALGTPVVTNVHGIEGIPARDGVHVTIGDDDDTLVRRTVELLRSDARRESQRRAARLLLSSELAIPNVLDRVEEGYRKIPRRSRAA